MQHLEKSERVWDPESSLNHQEMRCTARNQELKRSSSAKNTFDQNGVLPSGYLR